MELRAYLEKTGVTATALARTIGVSHTTILRLADGTIQPAMDTLRRLHVATHGAVAPNDFLKPITRTKERA